MKPTPDVSAIIVNWNTRALLARCLDSIYQFAGDVNFEVVVVDNASMDGSREMLREQYPGVRVLTNDKNYGFAVGNNQGARAALGRYVLLLNSDAFLTPGALPALLALAESDAKIGMVGAQLVYPDGRFQASHTPIPTLRQEFLILSGLGRLFYGPSYPSHGPEGERGPQRAGYVEGACMLAPRRVFEETGGLDEGYFMYAEDVDLCCAVQRRGYQVWYHPGAKVIHVGGASSKHRKPGREADMYRSRVRFFRKYYGGGAAAVLKGMIYFFTLVKNIYHPVIGWVSGGRLGRPVVPLRMLHAALKGV